MLAISLVFEYDFNKQLDSGRTWGKVGYKSKDFIFEWSPQQNWLDLGGMESPARTSSLAIGEHVSRLFQKNGVLN